MSNISDILSDILAILILSSLGGSANRSLSQRIRIHLRSQSFCQSTDLTLSDRSNSERSVFANTDLRRSLDNTSGFTGGNTRQIIIFQFGIQSSLQTSHISDLVSMLTSSLPIKSRLQIGDITNCMTMSSVRLSTQSIRQSVYGIHLMSMSSGSGSHFGQGNIQGLSSRAIESGNIIRSAVTIEGNRHCIRDLSSLSNLCGVEISNVSNVMGMINLSLASNSSRQTVDLLSIQSDFRDVVQSMGMSSVSLARKSRCKTSDFILSNPDDSHHTCTIHRDLRRRLHETSSFRSGDIVGSIGIDRCTPSAIGFQELILITLRRSRNQSSFTSAFSRRTSEVFIDGTLRQLHIGSARVTLRNLQGIALQSHTSNILGDGFTIGILSSSLNGSFRQILGINLTSQSIFQISDIRNCVGMDTSSFTRKSSIQTGHIRSSMSMSGIRLSIQETLQISDVGSFMSMLSISLGSQSCIQPSNLRLIHSSNAHDAVTSDSNLGRSFDDTSSLSCGNPHSRASLDGSPGSIRLQILIRIGGLRSRNQAGSTSFRTIGTSEVGVSSSFREMNLRRRTVTLRNFNGRLLKRHISDVFSDRLTIGILSSLRSLRNRGIAQIQIGDISDNMRMLGICLTLKGRGHIRALGIVTHITGDIGIEGRLSGKIHANRFRSNDLIASIVPFHSHIPTDILAGSRRRTEVGPSRVTSIVGGNRQSGLNIVASQRVRIAKRSHFTFRDFILQGDTVTRSFRRSISTKSHGHSIRILCLILGSPGSQGRIHDTDLFITIGDASVFEQAIGNLKLVRSLRHGGKGILQVGNLRLRDRRNRHHAFSVNLDLRRGFHKTSSLASRHVVSRVIVDRNRPSAIGFQEFILITLSRSGNQSFFTSSLSRSTSEGIIHSFLRELNLTRRSVTLGHSDLGIVRGDISDIGRDVFAVFVRSGLTSFTDHSRRQSISQIGNVSSLMGMLGIRLSTQGICQTGDIIHLMCVLSIGFTSQIISNSTLDSSIEISDFRRFMCMNSSSLSIQLSLHTRGNSRHVVQFFRSGCNAGSFQVSRRCINPGASTRQNLILITSLGSRNQTKGTVFAVSRTFEFGIGTFRTDGDIDRSTIALGHSEVSTIRRDAIDIIRNIFASSVLHGNFRFGHIGIRNVRDLINGVIMVSQRLLIKSILETIDIGDFMGVNGFGFTRNRSLQFFDRCFDLLISPDESIGHQLQTSDFIEAMSMLGVSLALQLRIQIFDSSIDFCREIAHSGMQFGSLSIDLPLQIRFRSLEVLISFIDPGIHSSDILGNSVDFLSSQSNSGISKRNGRLLPSASSTQELTCICATRSRNQTSFAILSVRCRNQIVNILGGHNITVTLGNRNLVIRDSHIADVFADRGAIGIRFRRVSFLSVFGVADTQGIQTTDIIDGMSMLGKSFRIQSILQTFDISNQVRVIHIGLFLQLSTGVIRNIGQFQKLDFSNSAGGHLSILIGDHNAVFLKPNNPVSRDVVDTQGTTFVIVMNHVVFIRRSDLVLLAFNPSQLILQITHGYCRICVGALCYMQ